MIVYISPDFARIMPNAMPIGVAAENNIINHLTSLKSLGNVLTSAMPKELDAAPLWIAIARIIFSRLVRFCERPAARPSKQLWVERAIISMKGVILHEFAFFICLTVYWGFSSSKPLFPLSLSSRVLVLPSLSVSLTIEPFELKLSIYFVYYFTYLNVWDWL